MAWIYAVRNTGQTAITIQVSILMVSQTAEEHTHMLVV